MTKPPGILLFGGQIKMNQEVNRNRRVGEMKKLIAVFAVLALLITPVTGFAGTVHVMNSDHVIDVNLQEPDNVNWVTGHGRKDWVLHWATDDNYLKKFPGMTFRGISNAAFGWVELLTHPIRWNRNAPAGFGLFTGLIMGPIVGTLRTVSGAIDIATGWIPFWYGVPMEKPVLGLHDVHEYEVIESAEAYDYRTKRFFFDGNKEDF
jgi:putative exosortase-associated protein (TIGR04073 family)